MLLIHRPAHIAALAIASKYTRRALVVRHRLLVVKNGHLRNLIKVIAPHIGWGWGLSTEIVPKGEKSAESKRELLARFTKSSTEKPREQKAAVQLGFSPSLGISEVPNATLARC